MRVTLCIALLSGLLASAAHADDTVAVLQKSAQQTVEKKLVGPLSANEEKRSKFSRARMPPRERRVRMLEAPAKDGAGAQFLTFAVDERYGFGDDTWNEGTLAGCVYPGSGEIYVKVGDRYRPSAMILGKKSKSAPAHVCQAVPAVAVR